MQWQVSHQNESILPAAQDEATVDRTLLRAHSHRRALRGAAASGSSTAGAATSPVPMPAPPPYDGRILKKTQCKGLNCKVFVLLIITFGVMAAALVATSVITKCA